MTRFHRAAPAALVLALACGDASAVTLATDGIGEVAVAPYYRADEGWQTLVNVVNTQDAPVAVRMRLREADNGRRVLDLTIALAAKDVFVGVIREGANGQPVFINTDDRNPDGRRTCTVPATTDAGGATVALPLQRSGFSGTDSAGDSNANGIGGDSRTRSGHIEFIVMGYADASTGITPGAEVSGSPITAQTYAALGTLAQRRNYVGRAIEAFDCETVLSAFETAYALNTARQFGEPISALKVNVALLNPQRGIEAGYAATHWAGFYSPGNGSGGAALGGRVLPADNWNCDLHRGVERLSARTGPVVQTGTNWCPDGSSGNLCNQNVLQGQAALAGAIESCRNLITPHTESTALEPSLNDAFPQTADVYFEELNETMKLAPRAAVYSTGLGGIEDIRGIDAFSLTIQRARMMNEWSVNPALGVGTDWIINQPTKNFYVDQSIGEQSAVIVDDEEAPTRATKGRVEAFLPGTGPNTRNGYGSLGRVPYPPYESKFTGFAVWVDSCSGVRAEERSRTGASRGPDPTGRGPFAQSSDTVFGALCFQTDVLTATAPSEEDYPQYPQLTTRTGWLTLGLDYLGDDGNPATPDRFGAAMPTENDGVLRGLPVIGFAIRTRNFPNRPDLSFSDATDHAYTRLLVAP